MVPRKKPAHGVWIDPDSPIIVFLHEPIEARATVARMVPGLETNRPLSPLECLWTIRQAK
jgi:hypothetical protein